MEKNYIIKFKDQKIKPIQLKIVTDEANNCYIRNYITIKEKNYRLDTSGTYKQVIEWIKKELWKFPIEEIIEEKLI